MKSEPLNHIFKEMTAVYDEMLASLSTLQSLGSIEFRFEGEQNLVLQALTALVENYGVERCTLYLLQHQTLRPAAAVQWKNGQICGCTVEQGSGCAGMTAVEASVMERALLQLQLQCYDDCFSDTRLQALLPDTPEPGCTRSLLCAPLVAGGDPIGVLTLTHSETAAFGVWQQRFIPLFTLFLGQTLTASRLLSSLEDEVRQRTSRLERVLEETRQLKEHYQNLSLVDALTGLFNRRFFFSEGNLVVARAVRYRHPAAFIILDLDDFKLVNDRFGHAVGDLVLKDVAKALRDQLRDSDILARIGGEEFALVLPETGIEGARELGERLLKAIRALSWRVDGVELRTSFSGGIAALPWQEANTDWHSLGHDDLLEQLFSAADRHLYRAKEEGGDRLLGGVL